MRVFAVCAALALAACERGLTPTETEFADALFGDTLNAGAVTVHAGLGLTPLPRPKPPPPVTEPPRSPPEGFCKRIPQPRRFTYPAAFVLYNDVFISHPYYAADTLRGWPVSVPLPQSLLMTHELVHVWQWQNRDRTEYRPAVSAGESVEHDDPYYWEAEADRPFLSYGFEQQAAMIEDYVCYRLFEPGSPRLKELQTLLGPVLPLDGFEAALAK